MTRTETLTFCLECGARVTDWTDGECPESTDKRHGPLKDVEYTAGADVVGLTLRIHDLEAALLELHAATDPWMENAPPGEQMTEAWAATFSNLAAARTTAVDALGKKGQRAE